jgi:ABC-type amino acid transport substrate-binding protein
VEFVPIDRDDLAHVLDSGICDIVMSGLVVTVRSGQSIDFSSPYHQEAVGFLVPDHRRAMFDQMATLRERPLALGAPSARLAEPVQRLLPAATVRAVPLKRVLDSGQLDGLDAIVLPMDQAYYISRMQPALSAVAPGDSRVRAVVAYGVPMGAIAFRDVVNNWVDVSTAAGLFSDTYDYWVRGKAQAARTPRWSIASNVLGWW